MQRNELEVLAKKFELDGFILGLIIKELRPIYLEDIL